MLAKLNVEIELNESLAKDMRIAIKTTTKHIEDVETTMNAKPDDQGLIQRRDKLVNRRDNLIASFNVLNGITPKLEDQKESLSALSLG